MARPSIAVRGVISRRSWTVQLARRRPGSYALHQTLISRRSCLERATVLYRSTGRTWVVA
jgi:hypothetical protein